MFEYLTLYILSNDIVTYLEKILDSGENYIDKELKLKVNEKAL